MVRGKAMKQQKCDHCGDSRVLWEGGKSYCAGCFEAGARSIKELWDAVNNHIDMMVKK